MAAAAAAAAAAAPRKHTLGPRITSRLARLQASRIPRITSCLLLLLLLQLAGGWIACSAGAGPSLVAGRRHAAYFGTPVGRLTGRSHNVSGQVYAVDEQTLFLRHFSYDGLARDAYFWSSVESAQPASESSFIVPDEKGSTKPLEAYANRDLVLRLPEGKTLGEIHWLSVWSRDSATSLGDIQLKGRQLNTPRPLEIAPLSGPSESVKSGAITIVDAQTLLVPDFFFDGRAQDAHFWVSRGPSLSDAHEGLKLRDQDGSLSPLRKYAGETVVVSLPDELTVHDFDHFGVWQVDRKQTLAETRFPAAARVPPSPRMLGIKPENKLNCEILHDELGFELRWVLDGDDIVMQLVGKIEPHEYMAFGLGKDDSSSRMERADAVVAWVDRTSGQVHALDYYLGAKTECNAAQGGPSGTCPDARIPGASDSLTLLHGAIVNGFSMVTFKRPQLGVDELHDQHVYSDGQQAVLWAIGPLNERREPGYHRLRSRHDLFIDFARSPQWNCPTPDLNATMHSQRLAQADTGADSGITSGPAQESAPEPAQEVPLPTPAVVQTPLSSAPVARREQPPVAATTEAPAKREEEMAPAWQVPAIVCPDERTLYAQLGPTGGPKRGFEARSGQPAWALAWYINGLLAPELVLERGQSYRLVVEGGADKTNLARRHPLYLTDSPEGGFDFKTDEQRLKERSFAGVGQRPDGLLVPTAEGRLCEWRPTNQTLPDPDQYPSFAHYQRSLRLECAPGQPALLRFTPDLTWPDQLYYQCYTHRSMGWRIRLVDSCAAHLSTAPHKSNLRFKAARRRRSEPQRRLQLADLEPADLASEQDMLLLNSSLLTLPPVSSAEHLTPGLNLSALEELVRVWPQALEFADGTYSLQPPPGTQASFQRGAGAASLPGPAESALEAAFVETQYGQLLPIELHNLTSHLFSPSFHPGANRTGRLTSSGSAPIGVHRIPFSTTTAKPTSKHGLQGYVKRLASFYYPVHQQLASMLQPSVAQAPQQVSTPASFSLSSLVPRPKIDLSKSSISKKLNKLRFKSKPAQETNGAQEPLRQPPKPSIEFNYHIFNSQLAELEKQSKQLQSLESLISWQQETAPLAYGPPEFISGGAGVGPQQVAAGSGYLGQPAANLQSAPLELPASFGTAHTSTAVGPFGSTQPSIFVARVQPLMSGHFGAPVPHLPVWPQQHQQQAPMAGDPQQTSAMGSRLVLQEARLPGERLNSAPQASHQNDANGSPLGGESDQVAIERYSKQASERLALIRQPSNLTTAAGSGFAANGSAPAWRASPGARFSTPLRHHSAASHQYGGDLLEAGGMPSAELSRLNSSAQSNHQPVAAESEQVHTFNWPTQSSTEGALFPSTGPPVRDSTSSTPTSEPVLSSNLLEPVLTSTLAAPPQLQQTTAYLSGAPQLNLDQGGPFTPNSIEQHRQFAAAAAHFHPFHNQLFAALRPQPPVQVASYLAQRFAAAAAARPHESAIHQLQERPMQARLALTAASQNQNQSQAPLAQENGKLVVLRPAGSGPLKQRKPHTYPLQAEYLRAAPVAAEQRSPAASDPATGSARRLANVQFERLSSLSSAPSTSFSFVDPMHASNSHQLALQAPPPPPQLNSSANQPPSKRTGEEQVRQEPAPSQQVTPEEADEQQALFHNSTHNAILSHVMSLIQANAIPSPPLVAISSYSSAAADDAVEPYLDSGTSVVVVDRNRRSLAGHLGAARWPQLY